MSFEARNFKIVLKSNISIFSFVSAFGVICKPPLSKSRLQRFGPMFSAKSFMVKLLHLGL